MFEPYAIVEANVDSCRVWTYLIKGSSDTSKPYVEKEFFFGNDGVIRTETSVHTEYFISNDSVIPIMETVEWHYREDGTVAYKNQMISCEKMPEFNQPYQIKEQYFYNFNDDLISLSFFDLGNIEKVYLYKYNDAAQLVEEQQVYPDELFSKSDFSQSRKVTYSYKNGSETTKTYDRTGTLLDSMILKIDSLSFTKVYTEYNYRRDRRLKHNPHIYKYVYNNKWELLSKSHLVADELISETIHVYSSEGLILKSITKDGDLKLFREYEYTFR